MDPEFRSLLTQIRQTVDGAPDAKTAVSRVQALVAQLERSLTQYGNQPGSSHARATACARRPVGEMPSEDARYMARAFATNRPSEALWIDPQQRIHASHVAKRSS